MFIDEVALELEGGQGGNGMVSFHRAKFVAYGPPDGGDGGDGGSLILLADENINTFRHFSGKKHFKAGTGVAGHKNNRAGHRGEDLILKVPVGTLVIDAESKEKLADLNQGGQRFVAAQGGRGGYGNSHFVSSTRQAPKFAELGDIGEKRHVILELQLLADVGLVGFPSAGKSTLISHLSDAKPKIGDYPFTTLIPNLGVVNLKKFGGSESQSFVLADLPGLIEGASEGKGLGDRFLKHISRSATLLFLLDPFSYDDRNISEQFKILRKELLEYNQELYEKDYLVAMNKIDAIPEEDRKDLMKAFFKDFPKEKKNFRLISGVSGEGLSELSLELWNRVQQKKVKVKKPSESQEEPVYTPIRFVDEQSYEVKKMYEVKAESFEPRIHGNLVSAESKPLRILFQVHGQRIEQISRMTNTDQEDAVRRVYDVLEKMGIQNALRNQGAVTGDYVKIGPHVFEFHDL